MKSSQTTMEAKIPEWEERLRDFYKVVWIYFLLKDSESGVKPWEGYHYLQLKELLSSELERVRKETIDEVDKDMAFCSCGDSLTRTGLYPKEATYYCFGCDKTYKLELKNNENKDF